MRRTRKRRLKRWVKISIAIVGLLLVVSIILLVINLIGNRDLKLVKDLEFELGKFLTVGDLIEDSRVEVTNLDEVVEVTSLGDKTVVIEYLKENKTKEREVVIKIVDTEKPVIEVNETITISVNSDINIEDLIKVSDNSNESITPKITGEYNLAKAGDYELVVKATDNSKNTTSQKIVLKVLKEISYNDDGSLKDGEYATSKGYTLMVKDGIATVDGVLIVNKTYSLPSNYESKSPYKAIDRIKGYCTDCIEDFVMEAFLELKKDASNLGLSLRINSGLRTYNTQKWLYNSYVSRDGKKEADTYSARAGHSEHQSGLCFDLNSTNDSFTNTEEGKWINDNAYKYGFIIRFPKGKEEYTGYNYESWHLRYVGKELAHKLYNNGEWISLEEYFGLTSEYPN